MIKPPFFTKKESIGIFTILFLLVGVSFYNFKISFRGARDIKRRDDLTFLTVALERFYSDYEMYPPASADGKIIDCLPAGITTEDIKKIIGGNPSLNRKKIFSALGSCEWGASSLADVSDPSIPIYLSVIPKDPRSVDGFSYFYFSTTKHYQLYGSFEGKDLSEYNKNIVARAIECGNRICNFGKASRGTPLDKSLSEYEKNLLQR